MKNYKNKKCVICGKDKFLVIHHKIPLVENGDNKISNLETLCEKCHGIAHKIIWETNCKGRQILINQKRRYMEDENKETTETPETPETPEEIEDDEEEISPEK